MVERVKALPRNESRFLGSETTLARIGLAELLEPSPLY